MMIDRWEIELVGSQHIIDGELVDDNTSRRISELVNAHLQEIGRDASGWDRLFRDPIDGRFWELIYPQSHLHGGGPPTLRLLRPEEAALKYGIGRTF